MNTLFNEQIKVTRIDNDVNGNPRYVFHYLNIARYLREQLADLIDGYDEYLLSINASGERKYHTKQYGGGIVFQSYNIQDSLNHIENRVIQYVEDFKTQHEKEKIANAIDELNLNKKLVKAYNFEDLEDMQNIASHGYQSGVSGFIYYSETVAFWRKHKKAIMEVLTELHNSIGEGSLIEMIQGFNGLKDYSQDEIGQAIYGRYNENLDTVYNTLVWACGENLAYSISEHIENN